jgi:hypothetical protein
MDEAFAVLTGIVLGLITHPASGRLRAVLIAVLGVALGALASWISGELAISWTHILIDSAQVIAVAVMTSILVRVWQRRHARRLAR